MDAIYTISPNIHRIAFNGGPWQLGTDIYVVAERGTNIGLRNLGYAAVYKSTDGGVTWIEKDAANEPNVADTNVDANGFANTNISAWYSLVDANFIHVCYLSLDCNNVIVQKFDITTDTWGAVIDNIALGAISHIGFVSPWYFEIVGGDRVIVTRDINNPSIPSTEGFIYYTGGAWGAWTHWAGNRALQAACLNAAGTWLHLYHTDNLLGGNLYHASIVAGVMGAITKVGNAVANVGWYFVDFFNSIPVQAFGKIYIPQAQSDGTHNAYFWIGNDIANPVLADYSLQAVPMGLDTNLDCTTAAFDGTTLNIYARGNNMFSADNYYIYSTDGATFAYGVVPLLTTAMGLVVSTSPLGYTSSYPFASANTSGSVVKANAYFVAHPPPIPGTTVTCCCCCQPIRFIGAM